MAGENLFDITIKKAACIGNLSEDDVRALGDVFEVTRTDAGTSLLVTSTAGVQVKFQFGADGSFQGTYAKINGKTVTIIPGTDSKVLGVFKGPPSNTNPGAGWITEPELTRKYLNQSGADSTWEIFYASRVSVLSI